MNVNKERLEKLIDSAIVCCEDCPIYEPGDWSVCDEYCQRVNEDTCLRSCKDALLKWLQEFDIAEALEEGAHIVNDQTVFHRVLPSDGFTLGIPCDPDDLCLPSCPWFDKCPLKDE